MILAGRVVSLLDMLRFYAELYTQAVREIEEISAKWPACDGFIPAPQGVGARVIALHDACLEHGLENTAKKCERIRSECTTKQVTFRRALELLRDLRERLDDELQGRVFLALTGAESRTYVSPLDGWQEVAMRFPRIRHDIEESSKCYSLGRYAASVFHVLLVAEYGVVELCRLLLPSENKPGWNAVERLEQIVKKKQSELTADEKMHMGLLKAVLPLLHSVKDSWRHKLTHVDNKLRWDDTDFSPALADEIAKATRGFMRRLAEELPNEKA